MCSCAQEVSDGKWNPCLLPSFLTVQDSIRDAFDGILAYAMSLWLFQAYADLF